MDREAVVRGYYAALDDHDYDALSTLLAPGFVHDRPDMTLDGRERFVRFMREERPTSDTTHDLVTVCTDGETVLARGRLLGGDEVLVRFVDAFTVEEDRLARLVTYTN